MLKLLSFIEDLIRKNENMTQGCKNIFGFLSFTH